MNKDDDKCEFFFLGGGAVFGLKFRQHLWTVCACVKFVSGATVPSGIVNSTDTWWRTESPEFASCCHTEVERHSRPTDPADRHFPRTRANYYFLRQEVL